VVDTHREKGGGGKFINQSPSSYKKYVVCPESTKDVEYLWI
jgi:hypothetical protein